jgi:hypothetical protein
MMKIKVFRYNQPYEVVTISSLMGVDARSGKLLTIDCHNEKGDRIEIICYAFEVVY